MHECQHKVAISKELKLKLIEILQCYNYESIVYHCE